MHVVCSKCKHHVSKVGMLWKVQMRGSKHSIRVCKKCRDKLRKSHGLIYK